MRGEARRRLFGSARPPPAGLRGFGFLSHAFGRLVEHALVSTLDGTTYVVVHDVELHAVIVSVEGGLYARPEAGVQGQAQGGPLLDQTLDEQAVFWRYRDGTVLPHPGLEEPVIDLRVPEPQPPRHADPYPLCASHRVSEQRGVLQQELWGDPVVCRWKLFGEDLPLPLFARSARAAPPSARGDTAGPTRPHCAYFDSEFPEHRLFGAHRQAGAYHRDR